MLFFLWLFVSHSVHRFFFTQIFRNAGKQQVDELERLKSMQLDAKSRAGFSDLTFRPQTTTLPHAALPPSATRGSMASPSTPSFGPDGPLSSRVSVHVTYEITFFLVWHKISCTCVSFCVSCDFN